MYFLKKIFCLNKRYDLFLLSKQLEINCIISLLIAIDSPLGSYCDSFAHTNSLIVTPFRPPKFSD